MDWSLLSCGTSGHVTFAPDEPALRGRLTVATREGPAWRCLRCETFVIGEPMATGRAAEAPRPRRAEQVRSALILRIFAVERFIRAVIVAALAIAVWRFSVSRLSLEEAYNQALPPLKALLRDFGFSVQHSKLLGLLHEAFTANSRTLGFIAIGLAAYTVIEVIEGVGLWMVKRWGEYFAMIATSLGLPYEIYDLSNKVTVLRVVAFVINLGLVLYLVLTKRLFGVRGGKKAYEAKLRSESLMDAEIRALAAGRETAVQAAAAGNSAPVAETPATAGPPWPDAETPAATGPSWPDAETRAATGPPWPDAEAPAAAGPPSPDAEAPAAAGPPSPDAETPAAAGPPSPDAETPAAGPSWPDAEARAATGPSWPDMEAPAAGGPPWPDTETPAAAGPSSPDAETHAAAGPPSPDAETPAAEPVSAEAVPAISEAVPAPADSAAAGPAPGVAAAGPAPAPAKTAAGPAPDDAPDEPAPPPLPRRRPAR